MSWKKQLQKAIQTPEALCDFLELPWAEYDKHYRSTPAFPIKVPLPFATRIQKRNWQDPLLRQVLSPRIPMLPHSTRVFSADPLQENNPHITSNPLPGVLQKYAHRILIISTESCAVHCQYCFRQHFPYTAQQTHARNWHAMLDFIQKDESIHEIIFSGGDPLMRPDTIWQHWLDQLAGIPHVHTVRWHTRLPVVIPERLTSSWIKAATSTRLRPILVLHSNHPQEWDFALKQAAQRAVQAGITVLNQGVILREINDNPQTLITMSWTLWSAQVLPYYWHRLDPVAGAEDYECADLAQQIPKWQTLLQAALPGYLVPRFVQEIPATPSKQYII